MELTTNLDNMTLWSIVRAAPLAVQLVMALLLFLSCWSWTLIFEKGLRLWRENQRFEAFRAAYAESRYLNELLDGGAGYQKSAMFVVFRAGMMQWQKMSKGSWDLAAMSSVRKIDRSMNAELVRQVENLERGMIVLASIGTAAPFIGLFGTVWGVMNAFMGIAATGNTTLAVVAPGIAEALLATALGLVAAIPASIAYNKFANDLSILANKLEDFAEEFSALLSDHLESKG
jgi:biopolymer transport protein TolQ